MLELNLDKHKIETGSGLVGMGQNSEILRGSVVVDVMNHTDLAV